MVLVGGWCRLRINCKSSLSPCRLSGCGCEVRGEEMGTWERDITDSTKTICSSIGSKRIPGKPSNNGMAVIDFSGEDVGKFVSQQSSEGCPRLPMHQGV